MSSALPLGPANIYRQREGFNQTVVPYFVASLRIDRIIFINNICVADQEGVEQADDLSPKRRLSGKPRCDSVVHRSSSLILRKMAVAAVVVWLKIMSFLALHRWAMLRGLSVLFCRQIQILQNILQHHLQFPSLSRLYVNVGSARLLYTVNF